MTDLSSRQRQVLARLRLLGEPVSLNELLDARGSRTIQTLAARGLIAVSVALTERGKQEAEKARANG